MRKISLEFSVMMNAAAPEGRPAAGQGLKMQLTPCPPCLGEALRRGPYPNLIDFHVSV